MPARQCFRSSGVAPRFCARHLAKNPPPAPYRPAPASASLLPSPAPPPVALAGPAAAGPGVVATDLSRVHPLPVPALLLRRSRLPLIAPPPFSRTPILDAALPYCSPHPPPRSAT